MANPEEAIVVTSGDSDEVPSVEEVQVEKVQGAADSEAPVEAQVEEPEEPEAAPPQFVEPRSDATAPNSCRAHIDNWN